MKEMPDMVDTYNRFKGRGLEFVAVAMKYDAPMYVTNYAQTRNLPFKVAMDDGSAAKQFGNVQLTPTTFVVDKDGKILKRYVGEPTFAELDALLDKALNAVWGLRSPGPQAAQALPGHMQNARRLPSAGVLLCRAGKTPSLRYR